MRDTQRVLSNSTLAQLTERAHHLATRIEWATRSANNPTVRREGSRFGEVIDEWLDDLRGLVEADDDAASERLASFEKRLARAERKVGAWRVAPMPERAVRGRRPRRAANDEGLVDVSVSTREPGGIEMPEGDPDVQVTDPRDAVARDGSVGVED
jgi:hypothetical protein